MKEKILFTSESVSEGHPDKVCDQIADAILDAVLKEDKDSFVACECFASTDFLLIGGEITTRANVDYEKIARDVIKSIGYDKDELFIVVTSFEPEPCVVSLALDELLIPMHMQDEQMTSEGLWIVNRIREDTSCMVIELSNCKD